MLAWRPYSPARWADTRLVDLLCPDGKGVMAILEAYADDSTRPRGMFCVAGYIFAPQQAKKFVKEWRKAHEPRMPCHMTDLATGQGIYQDLADPQRNALVRRSVEIINRRVMAGVVISCDLREFKQAAPPRVKIFRSAYAVCSHLAMQRVGMWLGDAKRTDTVAYVFEAGTGHTGEADELITAASKDASDPYRYQSHAFVPKVDSVALQSADLFAWEWTKFMDETVTNPIRPSRLSFRALIHAYPKRYIGIHLTGDVLREYMSSSRKSLDR